VIRDSLILTLLSGCGAERAPGHGGCVLLECACLCDQRVALRRECKAGLYLIAELSRPWAYEETAREDKSSDPEPEKVQVANYMQALLAKLFSSWVRGLRLSRTKQRSAWGGIAGT
jgi:hypothetical protein